jgi:voltage-gated potassium channel
MLRKIKKLLHWSERSIPAINLNTELYQQLKPFRLPLILTVLMIMIGALGYMIIDDFSLDDAIYQAGITFTTVGFGEIAPISKAGRIFTLTLIILGFGVFSFSIGILVEVLNKGDFIRILKERQMLYKIARLKNHFVICYHNEYTIELTKQFRDAQIPFVVVAPNSDLSHIAQKNRYPYFVQEEPHTQTALLKSCLSSAKGLITLSENLADNIAMIATTRLYEKEIALKKPYFIMSQGTNQNDMEKLKKLGADSVVSATKLMAQRISAMSVRPDMENMLENILYRRDIPLDMEEIIVPEHSWLRFKKIKEAHIREILNVSIVGIEDKNGKFIPMPRGDTLISGESKLLVIGTGEGIKNTKIMLNSRYKPQEVKYV